MHHQPGEFEDGMETGTVSTVVVTLLVAALMVWGAFKFGIITWGSAA